MFRRALLVCGSAFGGVGGVDDDAGHGAGVGDQGQVPGVDLGDVGVRTVGHEQQLGWRDGVVSGADHGPGRDGLPSGRPGGFGEGAESYGSLGSGQDRDLAGWYAVGEAVGGPAVGMSDQDDGSVNGGEEVGRVWPS